MNPNNYPEQFPDPDLSGKQVGDWLLEEKLGSGGMSIVYRGKHVSQGTLGAVKLLRAELCHDSKALYRFQREAKAAGRLNHPNIIHCQDFGRDPLYGYFMVLDYLRGVELDSLLPLAPFAKQWILPLAQQVCSALSTTHKASIIHRDLKPSNIFLLPQEPSPQVKILDFGVAKVQYTTDELKLTSTGTIVGTPTYLAPEQIIPRMELTHSADIYAFGVVLYQLFTGELPIDNTGRSLIEYAILVLRQKPTPAGELRPELAGTDLETFLQRILSKKAQNRPPSMKQVWQELQDAAQSFNDPLSNNPPPFVPSRMDDASNTDIDLPQPPPSSPRLESFEYDALSTAIIRRDSPTPPPAAENNDLFSLDLLFPTDQPAQQNAQDELSDEVNTQDESLPDESLPPPRTAQEDALQDHRPDHSPSPASPQTHPSSPTTPPSLPASESATPSEPAPPRPSSLKKTLLFGFVVLLLLAAGVGAALLWRRFSPRTPAPPQRSLFERLAMEGGESFRRAEQASQRGEKKKARRYYARAARLWKKATRQPAPPRSRKLRNVYKGIGVALARQNLLHASLHYYKKYMEELPPHSPAAQKAQQRLRQLQAQLRQRKKEGQRLLGLFLRAVQQKKWYQAHNHYQAIEQHAPSIPPIHQQLAKSLSPHFPYLALRIYRKIGEQMEATDALLQSVENAQNRLLLQLTRQQQQMYRLFQQAKTRLQHSPSAPISAWLKKKISLFRFLSFPPYHRAFWQLFHDCLRQHPSALEPLLFWYYNQHQQLVARQWHVWLIEQERQVPTPEKFQEQLTWIRQLQQAQKHLQQAQHALARDKKKRALRQYKKALHLWAQLQQRDRWQFHKPFLSLFAQTQQKTKQLQKALELWDKATRLREQGRFAKAALHLRRLEQLLPATKLTFTWRQQLQKRKKEGRRLQRQLQKAQRLFRQNQWLQAERIYRNYLRRFPQAHDRKKIQKRILLCECGRGVPWRLCPKNKSP